MNYYLSIKHKLILALCSRRDSGCSLSYLLVFSQQPSTRLLNFLLCIQHYIFNVTVNNFTFFLFQNTNDINKFDILTVIFLVQHLWFLFHSLFSLSFPSLSLSPGKNCIYLNTCMYFLLFFSRSRTKWNNGKTTKFYSINQKL